MQQDYFQDQEICFPYDSPLGKEEGCGHNFQIWLLRTTTNGQGGGGEQGNFILTYKGTSALSGQALHRFDAGYATTQWVDLSMLCYVER